MWGLRAHSPTPLCAPLATRASPPRPPVRAHLPTHLLPLPLPLWQVFVGGLAWDTDEASLSHAFGVYGHITYVRILTKARITRVSTRQHPSAPVRTLAKARITSLVIAPTPSPHTITYVRIITKARVNRTHAQPAHNQLRSHVGSVQCTALFPGSVRCAHPPTPTPTAAPRVGPR